jgi:hypothetical protein
MKLNELKKTDKMLKEEINNAPNNTPFSKETLFEIAKQDRDAEWSAPMSAEQLIESFKNV